jgi:ABC-2 type transport system permease protein
MNKGFSGETIAIAKTEIWRLFRKGRSYIGFGAVSFIIIVIQIALVIDGEPYLNVGLQSLRDSFVFSGNLLNGYLSVYLILTGLWVHVPFLIALVTGDLIAGEASSGTLRLLLSRPVRRSALLAGKFSAAVFYVLMMIVIMAALSLGLGYLTLGTGDLMVMRDTIYIFPEDDVLWRFLSAFAFSILSMTTVAALTFMFSAFADNGVTPIIITMSIIIAFLILSAIDLLSSEPSNPSCLPVTWAHGKSSSPTPWIRQKLSGPGLFSCYTSSPFTPSHGTILQEKISSPDSFSPPQKHLTLCRYRGKPQSSYRQHQKADESGQRLYRRH